MKLNTAVACGLFTLPAVSAWGSLGHITTAYIASNFVSNTTEAHLKKLLKQQDGDYLASIASWADSVRYMKWARFTKNFHFIDAHDQPPTSCNVDLERDCKADGCVISALSNYTQQAWDSELPDWLRAQAAKFVVHFVGDMHQPLHTEDVARGGNGISVRFDKRTFNLHHVWDTSILEKWLGGVGKGRSPYALAESWATQITEDIIDGKYAAESAKWLDDVRFDDANGTAMAWARETNALVCSYVLPQGPEAIRDQELGGEYYEAAAPILEKQVARAGYRMAAWLDEIVDAYQGSGGDGDGDGYDATARDVAQMEL